VHCGYDEAHLIRIREGGSKDIIIIIKQMSDLEQDQHKEETDDAIRSYIRYISWSNYLSGLVTGATFTYFIMKK
jgi:hypothetical protein